jgi:hypothetical protein
MGSVDDVPSSLSESVDRIHLTKKRIRQAAIRFQFTGWDSILNRLNPPSQVASSEGCIYLITPLRSVFYDPHVAWLQNHGNSLPGECSQDRFDGSFFSPLVKNHLCIFSVSGLTLPRTASGHNAPFQIQQSPNVAAMRWRGLLGTGSLAVNRCSAQSTSSVLPLCYLGNGGIRAESRTML